jgi:DNA repair protein RadA/Sms
VACFGEVGLTGELRSVGHPDRRLAEAAKAGHEPAIAPRHRGASAEATTLREALRHALGGRSAARAA